MWGAIPSFAKNKGGDLRVQPIKTQQPTFGINTNVVKRFDGIDRKQIITKGTLNNGKQLIVTDYYYRDNLIQKLQYLKDATGKWVKSKLKCYKNGKAIKTITSKREV